jgi:predicted ribosomally synthesized peptide with SipW-like signal peptide
MRTPRAKIIASIGALAVIVGAGSYGTFAAFSDTASNSGNAFSAGTLNISDGGTTSAMFSLSGLRPGDSAVQKCITVSNSGTLSFGSLKFYGTVTGTLAGYLEIQVERGTGAAGGATASCTGFTGGSTIVTNRLLNTFPTSASPVDEGANPSGWGAGQSKSYRVTVQLPSSVTASAAEGASANLTLNWDATS